jgi:phosphoglycerol transferase MdoB-like AlkP superfamily enzyme
MLEEGKGFEKTYGYTQLGGKRLSSWGTEDRCLIDRLIQWIEEKPGQPFLAVCWTDQTHDPYTLSPGVKPVDFFQGKPPTAHAADLSRYLTILHETDRHLGRLFAMLRARGLADDTLVVVTGDHGEAFSDPHDQRGHSLTVYQEEVSVPLMLWNPRLFREGRRVANVGGHVDMNPTITDVLGIKPPNEWQGHSLFDPSRPERTYFFASAGEHVFGMREGMWKYLFDATSGREMLFNLGRDVEEQRNIASSEQKRCEGFRKRVAGWVAFEEEFVKGRVN